MEKPLFALSALKIVEQTPDRLELTGGTKLARLAFTVSTLILAAGTLALALVASIRVPMLWIAVVLTGLATAAFLTVRLSLPRDIRTIVTRSTGEIAHIITRRSGARHDRFPISDVRSLEMRWSVSESSHVVAPILRLDDREVALIAGASTYNFKDAIAALEAITGLDAVHMGEVPRRP